MSKLLVPAGVILLALLAFAVIWAGNSGDDGADPGQPAPHAIDQD